MTTNTTTNLRLAARKLDRPIVITAVVLAIFLVAIVAAAVGHHMPAPVAAVPTPGLVILIATPASPPTRISVASASASLLPRAVVAYASPDGSVIGAVEAGRHYGFLARSGDGWLQLAIDGSGAVWVRASDLIGAPDLADVATPTSAPRVVIVRQPISVSSPPTPSGGEIMSPPPDNDVLMGSPNGGYQAQGPADAMPNSTDDWTQDDDGS